MFKQELHTVRFVASVWLALLACTVLTATPAAAADDKWVAAWSTSPQPYPLGFDVAQPGPAADPGGISTALESVFPSSTAENQSVRMIVHPSIGGRVIRVRLSNAFGKAPVTFGATRVGIQRVAGRIERGSNRRVTFGGRRSVTIPAGRELASDPVRLTVRAEQDLAVSLFVRGRSSSITWHAAAFTTNYLAGPDTGDHTAETDEGAYPNSTSSWFWVDGVDVRAPKRTKVVAALADSITDGFFSSPNENDRWLDVLARRLEPRGVSVVNQAIGGNTVTRVPCIVPGAPAPGPCGEPALDRLDRDVLARAGLTHVILFMGTNDISAGQTAPVPADEIIAGTREIARRVRAKGVKILAGTLTPRADSCCGWDDPANMNAERRKVNDYLRASKDFDGVIDFDAITRDPARPDSFRRQFVPNSTVGGPGDELHPNRAGFQAMGRAIPLGLFE